MMYRQRAYSIGSGHCSSGALMVAIAQSRLGPVGGLRRRDDRAKHRHRRRQAVSVRDCSASSTARSARWRGG